MGKRLFDKSITKRIISLVLCAALVASSFFGTAQANSQGVSGTYQYSAFEGSNKQSTDSFEYHDECFQRPSSMGCRHLITLSAQAAISSRSRFGENEDKYEQNTSNGAQNVKAFLSNMGFEDVEANEWYSHEMQEDSVGVSVGHRTINANGKTYTLLAIIPRSAGYRQEWAGDMNVEKGNIHKGFKEARDEALRFTKQYINKHNISGNLKVWIAGHSRGGAVSNVLGGFFAGGGISYFGDDVSITPDDVYCYTFATPRTIRQDASNNEVLSVDGARSGVYIYDTPGEAYQFTGGGIIEPVDDVFNGIRNYPFPYDIVTYLPFDLWGYTYYGDICEYEGVTEDMMMEQLKALDENVYDKYEKDSSPSGFHEKTFDIASLSVTDVPLGLSGEEGMIYFIQNRLIQGIQHFDTIDKYVDGDYQEALSSYSAAFFMMQPIFDEIEGVESLIVQPMLFSYLDFAAEKLMEEGRASTEMEGAAIALLEIIEFAIDDYRDIDSYNADEFVVDLANFVKENKDKEAVAKIKDAITKAIPPSYAGTVKSLLGNFYHDPTVDVGQLTLGDVILDYIIACTDGAAGTKAAQSDVKYNDPKEVRKFFYTVLSTLGFFNEDINKIKNAVDNGNGLFKDVSKAVLEFMMKYKNPDTGGTETYTTLSDAADGEFKDALDVIDTKANVIINSKGLYNLEFKDMLNGHIAQAKDRISEIRIVIMDVLFDNDSTFDTEYNINNLATLIGNINRIPFAHYNELCIAYAKAGNDLDKDEDVVVLAPIANYLVYNGQAQDLVLPGYITNSDVYYALSDSEYIKPDDDKYSLEIPKGTNPGTYYVWYKGVGDVHHKDTSPGYIVVTIAESGGLVPNAYGNKVANVPKTKDILRSVI